MNTITKIKQLICDISPNMPSLCDITEGKRLREDYGFESFEFIQLIVSIEEEFGFEFAPEFLDIHLLNEVEALYEYINEKCIDKPSEN